MLFCSFQICSSSSHMPFLYSQGLDILLSCVPVSTTKTDDFSITIIRFLIIPLALLVLQFAFISMNFWSLLVNRLRFPVSLHSSELSSLDSTSVAFVLSARLLFFFSIVSISFSLVISNSCSLDLPKSDTVLSVVKSLVSNITFTLGCQLLSRHFRILMFSSSLSNCFPYPIKWLTM